ncbi:hypothetical protein BGZ83_011803 [Gryganskiella cystojenkinii]|nr:hypothetical protein BGZ83_011803 [Gryganskiella cystojenkinii]
MEFQGPCEGSYPEEWLHNEDLDNYNADRYNDGDDDDSCYYLEDRYYYYDPNGNMCSDIYDDYSVKAKATSVPVRSRYFSLRKFKSKTPKHQSTASVSPFIIHPPVHESSDIRTCPLPPEVLHLVFSYLDNATLCRGVSFVSRQFNSIAKYYIECLWTLGTQRDEDALLEKLRLGKVNVLKIRYSASPPKDSGRPQPFDDWGPAWKRFRDLITEPIKGHAADEPSEVYHLSTSTETMPTFDGNDPSQGLLQGVKKLIMDGGNLWTPEILPTLLPFARSLHTLILKPWSWEQTLTIPWERSNVYEIPLNSVLESCPSIQTLVIHGAVSLCWNKADPSTSICDSWNTFRLSRFIVTNVTTTQEAMENFLNACPRLVCFKGKNMQIRMQGTSHEHLHNMPSLAIKPLLEYTSLICPDLVDLSISPISCSSIDTFEHLLAKFSYLFPRTKLLIIGTNVLVNPSWLPSPSVTRFLAQVTGIEFLGRAIDDLLKHTPALERLESSGSPYSRPGVTKYPNLKKDVIDSVRATLAKRERRPGPVVPLESYQYDNYAVRYYLVVHSKLAQQISKRLMRKEMMDFGSGKPRTPIETEYWTKEKSMSMLPALGGLVRLEVLVLNCNDVAGILCPQDFKFMWATTASLGSGERGEGRGERPGGRRSRDENEQTLDGQVFCPRLKHLQVCSSKIHFGLSKEKPLEDKTVFVNALKSMRPGVEFKFSSFFGL